jgi:hypothetical protein
MRKLFPAAVTALVLAVTPTAGADPIVSGGDVAHGAHSSEMCVPGPRGGGSEICGTFTITVDAHSGPSGEAPRGTVTFSFFAFNRTASVTCLSVDGNRAAVEFVPVDPFGPIATVVYLQDDEVDRFAWASDLSPGACTPPREETISPANGFAEVHDAQPAPATAADCKKGGWRQYGFRNQGACVSSLRPAPAPR